MVGCELAAGRLIFALFFRICSMILIFFWFLKMELVFFEEKEVIETNIT